MLGGLQSIRAHGAPLKSRRAMLETLLKHLPMVRLWVGAVAVVMAMGLGGCVGLIDGNGDKGLTPEQKIARDKFITKALPVLKPNCGQCHGGTQTDIAFLAGTSDLAVRDVLMGFDPQVVNTDAPQSSRLLTKGGHAGPALLASQAGDILEWVQAEKDAVGMGSGSSGPVLETTPFKPLLCTSGLPGDPTCPVNHVDLSPLGLAGATIDFVAQPLGATDLYVNNLKLNASTDGAYIEHPLFVSWPASAQPPLPDTLDRFFNVKMNLMATTAGSIGGGTAAFVGFVPTNNITIHFKVVDKYKVDGGGGSGSGSGAGASGCKRLADFKANAQAPMNTNCASCHAGNANANAKSAMDLDGIASTDDAMILLACNQVRTRINFQDTTQSGFYIAPNPANATGHPFKFGGNQTTFNTFKTAVDIWVQAEKTAP